MMANHAAAGVLEHLLFHKAMIDEGAGAEKIDRYLTVLHETGSKVLQRDPLDRSIETVFELVMSNDLDPWDIDLVRFSELYVEKVRDEEVNFVIAGKLMLMAWSILRMQSEQVLSNSEAPAIGFDEMDGLEAHLSDEPRGILCMPDEIELDEVIRHRGSRPVTLLELLEAFEEAQREEERNELREKLREANRARLDAAFDSKAHSDDMERDVEIVWQRICRCGSGPVDLIDIWEGGREDLVMVIMALLFLVRTGKISVWQEDLPFGPISLEVKMDWDIGTLEDAHDLPTPRAIQSSQDVVR